jgi:predicted aminopeptidase
MTLVARLWIPAISLLLSGCSTVSFYWQAFAGQMEVTRLARPLEEVLADPHTPPDLQRRLEYAKRAREFASRELALPDNASYRRYADLRRPYVAWNVFAAPADSLTLRTHCFPIAGCVVYRGYFSKEGADAEAAHLRGEGLDVYVGGVPAYSTLGWFADPLLNTFIRYPDLEIARLVFHELAHQVAYAGDDSTFNESFAVAVEEAGLRRWMETNATEEARASHAAYTERRRALTRLFVAARRNLEGAYGAPLDAGGRQAAKTRILGKLADDYAALKATWNLSESQARAYDEFVLKDLNNAKLASIATYTQRVAQFSTLLAGFGGDLPGVYAEVRRLSLLDKASRNRHLDQLAPLSKED